jgi:hypothetical protein
VTTAQLCSRSANAIAMQDWRKERQRSEVVQQQRASPAVVSRGPFAVHHVPSPGGCPERANEYDTQLKTQEVVGAGMSWPLKVHGPASIGRA